MDWDNIKLGMTLKLMKNYLTYFKIEDFIELYIDQVYLLFFYLISITEKKAFLINYQQNITNYPIGKVLKKKKTVFGKRRERKKQTKRKNFAEIISSSSLLLSSSTHIYLKTYMIYDFLNLKFLKYSNFPRCKIDLYWLVNKLILFIN